MQGRLLVVPEVSLSPAGPARKSDHAHRAIESHKGGNGIRQPVLLRDGNLGYCAGLVP